MTASLPIRYSLEKGVNFTNTHYDLDGGKTAEPGHLSFEEIRRLDDAAYPHREQFRNLIEEIEDAHSVPYAYVDARGQQKEGQLTYSLFNRKAGSETLKLVMLGWRSNYLLEGTKRGVAAIAMADPDQRYVVANLMGRGDSTPLPFSTSLEMARKRSYQPAGEFLLPALEQTKIFEDADGIDALGESEGHRIITALAAAGLKLSKVTLVDGPGIGKQSFMRLAKGLQKENSYHGPRFAANHSDEWSRRLHLEVGKQPLVSEFAREIRRGGEALANYVLHPYAMGRSSLERDTLAAVPNMEDVTFISCESSEVTMHEKTDAFLGRLACSNTRPEQIRHVVLHELSHSVPGPGARALLYNIPSTGKQQSLA